MAVTAPYGTSPTCAYVAEGSFSACDVELARARLPVNLDLKTPVELRMSLEPEYIASDPMLLALEFE